MRARERLGSARGQAGYRISVCTVGTERSKRRYRWGGRWGDKRENGENEGRKKQGGRSRKGGGREGVPRGAGRGNDKHPN